MLSNRTHLRLQVSGMSCPHCAQAVERAVKRVDGVRKVKVSLDEGVALVTAREGLDVARLLVAVREAGYEARRAEASR